jgi:ATP-dependent Zn protease
MEVAQITPPIDPLRPLALLAAGRSGADIERLVREARARARRQHRSIAWSDIEAALLSSERAPNATLDWSIALHEIGHAVVYTVLDVGEVRTAQIGGRGGATGVTAPVEVLQHEDGLTRLMSCLLAGRAAEELILGTIMIGSGGGPESDLAKATLMAIEMENSFGIGPVMPLVYRPSTDIGLALAQDQSLAVRVNARLEAAYDVARGIIDQHREVAIALATRLQSFRVIDGADIRTALARESRTA